MKKLLSLVIAFSIIIGIIPVVSFADAPGEITFTYNPYNWKTEKTIAHRQTYLWYTNSTDGADKFWNENTTTMWYDGGTSVIQPIGDRSGLSQEYKATGKNILATFTINKSADIYIACIENAVNTPEWLYEEGYKPAYDNSGNKMRIYSSNGEYFNTWKKTVMVSDEPLEINFYSVGGNTRTPCPILIDWKDNPENPSVVENSSYVYKGKSGDDGDSNIYTYIFSKILNPADGADYGVDANGKWYSLVKDPQDKTAYKKALSSGQFGIGLADPDGFLGDSYTVTPQIRFNGNILSSGTSKTIYKDIPETDVWQSEGSLEWPEEKSYTPTQSYNDKYVRFLPLDNYTSNQNPPDFLWRSIPESVSYDLIVCSDEKLTQLEYAKFDIPYHFYNFSYSFEPGIYYWAVRYKTENGTYSKWTEPRRFLIKDNASKVYIEDSSAIIDKVKSLKSPIYYNPEEIAPILETSEGQKFYKELVTKVDGYKNQTIDTSIKYVHGDGGTGLNNRFWNEVINRSVNPAINMALLYAIDKDEDTLKLLTDRVRCITEFDYPQFDSNTDTYTAQTARGLAICYDTVKDELSEELKSKVVDTVKLLVKKATDNLLKGRGLSQWETHPSASHEWKVGEYLIYAAILVGDEIESYDRLVGFLLPLYLNLGSAHTIEDGTYQGGIGYLRYTELRGILLDMDKWGVANLLDKPELKNSVNQYLYLWPTNEVGPFGDESYHKPDSYAVSYLKLHSGLYNDSYAKWMYNEIGTNASTTLNNLYYSDSEVAPKPPVNLPKSKYFPDGGFAGLHSDLLDKNRISLYFRSSWWGSYNHSHADQNSFVINAYGESLAIDSGFYPYFESPHHANYTRQTHAHNAITVDGKGQPTKDISAEGKITSFINHSYFDLVSGDASKAYKEERNTSPATLKGAKRDIIYLRPDTFIVIDDLEALDNTSSTFEFWLNAEEDITLGEDKKSALIKKGDARLLANVVYPKVTGEKLTGYCGIDGKEWPKEVDYDATNTPDKNQRNQQRVYFKTDKVNKTKMVTTLDVYKNGESSKNIITEDKGNGILKLTVSDGSIVYINTGDLDEVTVDGITFEGTAVVLKNNSYMLVNGTYLYENGVKIIESKEPVSVALGNGEIYISSIESDANVKVYAPSVNEIKLIDYDETLDLEENQTINGVLYNIYGDYINFNLYNGSYAFVCDSDSSLKSVSLSTTENGSNAVLLNDIEPGVFEYDFMYEDATCFNHTIIAETNQLGAKVEIKNATEAHPVATVKVTSLNGNTSTYTFNYKSISTYTKQAATGTVYTAYNNAMKTELMKAVVNSGYGYVYNGSTQKSVAVLKFPISALKNATEGIYLSMRNIQDGTDASLTFNIYSLTGSTTSTDYDEVIAMKDKLLGSASVKGSNPGSYIVKLDKDIIQGAIDDDNSTNDTITIIVENATQLPDYKSNMIFCTFNNNTYPLRLLYK